MADTVTDAPPQVSEAVCQGVLDVSTHTFTQPEKIIKGAGDIPRWEKSQAYGDLIGFILTLNEAVKGKKISDTYPISEPIQKVEGVLATLSGWIDEIPPVDQPQRFGNKAFRDFFTRLQQNCARLLTECLGEKYTPAIDELSVYLLESVGNSTRIDYGTGHELSFVAFLCCLYKIGVLTTADYVATVLRVFERYMELVRKLQKTYRMEPAGSHGVWSLDDYQFIPFIWGSSQLLGHPRIQPKSFPKPEISEHFYKDFMFLGCIKYINEVKTGPFPEHSNQLWNISGVGKWDKVNSGLVKMYKAEVLAKFPVIQHFMFGSLLTLQPVT
ncbi:serine/threonine-protein phosphatase 2A activator-like [Haliotis cracherodii]|uniref:serine/threonine-protein phosphatase 2A activator-like n=1 Tax=Haliotis cracherodii TaxID=6455 RepID=UPI0039E9BBFC